MTFVRIARTTSVTLSQTFYVDGVATDATGTPTVSIKRLDGTEVATPAVGHPSVGVYTYAVPSQSTLDTLYADMTGVVAGVTVTFRDWIEIVGGFIFTLAEARAMPPVLTLAQWPDEKLAPHRISTENECERICGKAFVPRFARVALSGNGKRTILLPRTDVRTIRAVTLDGATVSTAEVKCASDGVLRRESGYWTEGIANVVVEFEFGMDFPPPDLADAAMLRLRTRLNKGVTEIPARAASFTAAAGGVYRLSTPTREKTGYPDVDGAYEKYTVTEASFA